MHIVFVNYQNNSPYTDYQLWLQYTQPVSGIAKALVEKQHTVTCIDSIGYNGHHIIHGVQHYFFNTKNRKSYFPFRTHQLVKSLKPDAVIVHGTHFILQTLQLRYYVGSKTLIVVQNHIEPPLKHFKKLLQRWISHVVDAYYFPSIEMGKYWIENKHLHQKQKVGFMLEGSSYFKPIPKSAFSNRLALSGKPVYLWVGRLNANKNPFCMIDAFAQFLTYCPTAELYMVFYKNDLLDAVTKHLKNTPLAKQQIHLVGKIPNAEMEFWYNSADFIVSTSYNEGTSFSLSEAMACGCMPIVSNIPSLRAMTQNGQYGILYTSGSTNALLHALLSSQTVDLPFQKQRISNYFQASLSFKSIATAIEKSLSLLCQ